MEQSYICVGLLLCISLASAQLTLHLDANTNSYTLQTPNSQQSFTQHFNTRGGAQNQIVAAQSQQQPQLFATAPQQFASNQNNGQEDLNNYFRQQLELQQQQLDLQQQQQQQQQRQTEQNNLYTTYQAAQQQRQTAQAQPTQQEDLSTYYQQVQQAQLQQQQLQQQADFSAQQGFSYQQPETSFADNRAASQFAQFQPQNVKYQQQQAASNQILGKHFSPSNEVSHVKFSSGDLSYNF